MSFHYSLYAIPPAVTAAVVVSFAVYVALTRFSRTSMAILGVAAATAGWQIARMFMYLAADAHTALIWARISCAFVPFIAPALYQLVSTILESAGYRKIVAVIAWLIAAQFAVLALATNYLVNDVRRFRWGFQSVYNIPGRVFYPSFFALVFAAAILDAVRAYPKASGRERSRIRLLGIATAIASLAVIDFL